MIEVTQTNHFLNSRYLEIYVKHHRPLVTEILSVGYPPEVPNSKLFFRVSDGRFYRHVDVKV